MSGELDEVSSSIGELKGLMTGSNSKLDILNTEFIALRMQVTILNTEGCARGKSNGHRIEKLEATKLTLGDWGKLAGITTVISGVVAGIAKGWQKLGN